MLFTFPSRYWFAIGLWRVFSLGGWARRIHTGFHVPRATQDDARLQDGSRKGLSPSMAGLSRPFRSRTLLPMSRSYNPRRAGTRRVWAPPRSLATTWGITFVFFSYGYLDVSVPRVRFMLSMMSQSLATGFPIRTSAGHFVFADYRSFSQLITSFFASESHRHPPCALVCFPFFAFSTLFILGFELF